MPSRASLWTGLTPFHHGQSLTNNSIARFSVSQNGAKATIAIREVFCTQAPKALGAKHVSNPESRINPKKVSTLISFLIYFSRRDTKPRQDTPFRQDFSAPSSKTRVCHTLRREAQLSWRHRGHAFPVYVLPPGTQHRGWQHGRHPGWKP